MKKKAFIIILCVLFIIILIFLFARRTKTLVKVRCDLDGDNKQELITVIVSTRKQKESSDWETVIENYSKYKIYINNKLKYTSEEEITTLFIDKKQVQFQDFDFDGIDELLIYENLHSPEFVVFKYNNNNLSKICAYQSKYELEEEQLIEKINLKINDNSIENDIRIIGKMDDLYLILNDKYNEDIFFYDSTYSRLIYSCTYYSKDNSITSSELYSFKPESSWKNSIKLYEGALDIKKITLFTDMRLVIDRSDGIKIEETFPIWFLNRIKNKTY